MKEKLKNVLKEYVAPKLLDEAVDKMIAVVNHQVNIDEVPDVKDIQFTRNLPVGGTMFKFAGHVYKTTKARPTACELECNCAVCPIAESIGDVWCGRLDYGFEEVDVR